MCDHETTDCGNNFENIEHPRKGFNYVCLEFTQYTFMMLDLCCKGICIMYCVINPSGLLPIMAYAGRLRPKGVPHASGI